MVKREGLTLSPFLSRSPPGRVHKLFTIILGKGIDKRSFFWYNNYGNKRKGGHEDDGKEDMV